MNHAFTTALVTGASSGIGKALCDLLVEKKINLIISARNEEKLESLAKKWKEKVKVEVFSADLSNCRERQFLVECIHSKTPDLIINNAGAGFYGEAINQSTKTHLDLLELDCAAVMELTLEGAKALIQAKKKGTILNVSSVAGFQIFPYFATYASCKAFVNQFSQALHEELRDQGVNVLTACPGVVATHFQERAGGQRKTESGVMTASFAADQIWNQIIRAKPLHIFDWKYRLVTAFSKLIPQKMIFKLLKNRIASRRT